MYKQPEELGITKEEYNALLQTRNILSRLKDTVTGYNLEFDMAETGESKIDNTCGTAACIGGHMAILMGLRGMAIGHYVLSAIDGLEKLFYPEYYSNISYSGITKSQAIKAIDKFLETGDPQWNSIIDNDQ